MRTTLAIAAVASGLMFVVGFAAAEPPVAYRRIFVPADNPSSWPRGDQALLPIEESEFAALVATANAPPATATITEAHYESRLEGKELRGHGTWHVELSGKGPARIALPDPPTRLRNVRWRHDAATPVRIGWWPIDGSRDVEHALEVRHSGDLEFEWGVSAAVAAGGMTAYSLPNPGAARTQFVMNLPAGKQPMFTRGLVQQSPRHPEEGGRWIVALQPGGAATLRLQDTDPASAPSSAYPRIHQDLGYQLSPRGIELQARLHINACQSTIQPLKIVLPSGLKLVEARCEKRLLPWRIAEAPATAGATEFIVDLERQDTTTARTVSLLCWGPLALGERLKLPMLSIGEAFWTSGKIEVTIDDVLEPRELTPIESVQTAVDRVAIDAGHARRLSYSAFAPAAAVELVLAERPARGSVRMGIALDVGNPSVTARTVADFQVSRGVLRRLSANLLPGWTIDAVETIPAEALGEWYVDRTGERHVLDLQLHQAVAPDRPLRVVVLGRYEHANSVETLAVAKLSPLAWRGLSTTEKLLQLRAAEQYELEVAADLQYVAASNLTAAARSLFADAEDGPVCDLAANPPTASIRLAPKKGTYDATIQIDAELRQGRLRSSYRIECRPGGSGVDHVLVYLTQPGARPLEWFEAHSGARLSAERMPERDPRLGGLPRGGELWVIDLGRLYARPFAITASSTQPWQRRDRVPLAAIPDAASQMGRVSVSSAAVELPTIVAQGMSPTSLPAGVPGDGVDESAAVRAVYRFQPTRFYDAGQAAQLWIGPAAPSDDKDQLIATHVDVESRYAADGAGVHRVTYELQNVGTKSLEWALPSGVVLEAARVDGKLDAVTTENRVALGLPQRSEFQLELELSSRQPPLSGGNKLSSPLPEAKVAIFAGRWRVSLPQGFEVVDGVADDGAALDWRARWFGPLARRLGDSPFNPLDAHDWNEIWAELSRAVSTPAVAETRSTSETGPYAAGWHNRTINFIAGPPSAITIAHRPATSAIALALFLCCAIIPRVVTARGLAIVLLAAAAAAISLFLPAFYAPLGAAATLGFCAAAVWKAWHRIGLKSRAALALAAVVFASSPLTLAAEAPVTIEQVLIPVDAAGNQVGTKYFVTSDFWRRLMRGPSNTSSGGGWLIADMRCEGELVADQVPQSASRAAEWTLSCDVETFARDVSIELGLHKDEADWPPSASVDGIPTPLKWRESGRQCSIRFAEPGRHRVSIAFVPHVEVGAGRRSIALALPKIAGAEMSIAAPATVDDVRLGDVQLARQIERNRVTWRGALDGSGRLAVSWTAPRAEIVAANGTSVDQLSIFQIQPAELLLTTKFRRHGRGAWPDTLELALDDHWELLADPSVAQAADAGHLPDGRKTLRLRMTEAESDLREINLQFRTSGVATHGRLPLPRVEPISLNVESHFLAVTCDDALVCVPSFTPPASAAPVAELATMGLVDERAPQLLLNALQLKPDWYLAVRPREGVSAYEDRLSLAANKRRVHVEYHCDVIPAAADCFGWSLTVPPDLNIEQVAVTCEDESVPVDWTRSMPARLTIYFSRAATTRYAVTLIGSMPLPAGGRVPVPQIHPPRPRPADQVVALYRDENVLARWELPRESAPTEAAAGQAASFGEPLRYVRAYRMNNESASKSFVVVEPNRPVVSGDTLTTVSRDDDTWRATFQAKLRVERGVIDVLRLEAPANWIGPFAVKPNAILRFASATGNSTLVIRLPQPVPAGESIQLSVDSPLVSEDGEVPVAPRIKLLQAGARSEYLAVPATVGGQQADWTRRGIEPAELPVALSEGAAVPDGVRIFRVRGESIHVALRPRAAQASAANVRLADTSVRLDPRGEMITTTRFVIAPEGLPHCQIKLREGDELVRIQLDGHAALARSLDALSWQVQLGPPSLPQILEVVTRTLDSSSDRQRVVEVHRPALEHASQAIPVEFGLWTLHAPGSTGTPRVTGGTLVTPAELAAARFDRLLSISQSATRSVIESPLLDGYHWFARWSQGLEAAAKTAATLERQSNGAFATIRVPQPDDSLSETARRQEAWLDQINEIFAAAEWNAAAFATTEAESPDPWGATDADVGGEVSIISDGNEQQASVEMVPPGMAPNEARALLLFSLVAVGVVAIWLGRRPRAVAGFESWPEAIGLVLGLVAWAWLRPSALGLLVAAVSAVLLVRRVLGTRKSPRHDSSNQPSEIAEHVA